MCGQPEGGETGIIQPSVDEQTISRQNNVDNETTSQKPQRWRGRRCFSSIQEEEVEAEVEQSTNFCGQDGGNSARSLLKV